MKHFAGTDREKWMLLAGVVIILGMLAAGYSIYNLKSRNDALFSENVTLQEELSKTAEERESVSQDLKESLEKIEKLEEALVLERMNKRSVNPSFPYQTKYPELYVTPPALFQRADPNVVYLTFDDGPFPMTDTYLDILKKHGVKATFFVVGRDDAGNRARLKRIVEEGHTLAIHTYSHQYKQIYASVEAYLADFKKINDLIVRATGVKPTIFRFPGGSVNTYNKLVYRKIIAEMTRRGYIYYDWNYSAADASSNATAQSVRSNIMLLAGKAGSKIVLLHEGRKPTLEALEQIIVDLKAKGYKFDKLTNKVEPASFGYTPLRKPDPVSKDTKPK